MLFYLVLYSMGVYFSHTATVVGTEPLTWYEYFTQADAWSVAWPWLIILTAVCHAATAWEVLDERSLGVIKWAGYIFKRKLESGPHFVPWPTQLVTFPKNPIKVDWGTAREEDAEIIEQARKSPVLFYRGEPRRIAWPDIKNSTLETPLSKEQLKAFESNPLASNLFTDPHGYFTFKIDDPARFISEVGTIVEAIDRILLTNMAVLQEEAGKTCLALSIGKVREFSDRMRGRVEWLIGEKNATEVPGKKKPEPWGVDLIECHLVEFGTAHDTNSGLVARTAAIAVADGEATAATRRSEGERDRLTNIAIGEAAAKQSIAVAQEAFLAAEGRGQAAAALAKGKAANEVLAGQGLAEAAALEALGKAASSEGAQAILRLRAMEAALNGGKVTMVAKGMGDIADMLVAGKKVIDGVSGEK